MVLVLVWVLSPGCGYICVSHWIAMTLRDVSNRGGCCVSSVFVVLNTVHWSRGVGHMEETTSQEARLWVYRNLKVTSTDLWVDGGIYSKDLCTKHCHAWGISKFVITICLMSMSLTKINICLMYMSLEVARVNCNNWNSSHEHRRTTWRYQPVTNVRVNLVMNFKWIW